MNFGQAFTFVFEDPDWAKKVLIPALIALIPLVGQFFLIGWSLDVTRRVIQNNPRPLPDLDFGRQLVDGLKAFVIGLVYAIPTIIFTTPIVIVSIAAGNQNMNSNTAGGMVGIVSVCCGGLIFLYSILMMFILPAAYGNFAASDRLGAAFNFNEVIGLVRAAPGAYLMVLLGIIVSGFISGLGFFACGIGVLATLTYAQAINGHLYGQGYNEATRNRGFARDY
jgi:hypothetical protein